MNWHGPPTLLTWLLLPLACIYALAIRAWHLLFDLGLRKAIRVEGATVVSVGNLVVGGAGKTRFGNKTSQSWKTYSSCAICGAAIFRR